MIHSLTLWPQWRDVWGAYDPAVLPALAGLDHNECYKPRLYTAPSVAVQLLLPGAYLRYQMEVTAGSAILGYYCPLTDPLFTFQCTDLSTGLKFWDTPISNVFLSNPAGAVPSLLPAPRPVPGSGMFKCEFWAPIQNSETQRCYVVFMVAEVAQCQ